MMEKAFWQTTALADMNEAQWESLCDGCALCCLHKLQDEQTGDVHYTKIACRLLDLKTCRCTDYANRTQRVPECVDLKPARNADFMALPDTCAYKRLYCGQDIPDWHPLKSGKADAALNAGVSVYGRAISERDYQGDYDEDTPLLDLG